METNYTFFIICPLDLEQIVCNELQEILAANDMQHAIKFSIHHGGISLQAPLDFGFKLNQIMQTPTRILLRIEQFKCKDSPKLFNKISKLPWAKYIIGNNFEVEAKAHESRLFDSRKIEKAVTDGINHFIQSNPLKKKYIQLATDSKHQAKIYIRIEHDECTVSIDTSGDLLHRRGEKEMTGLAPIRENLAAALLLQTLVNLTGELQIIDPMSGSGTFLLEAYRLQNVQSNLQRRFAYHYMPVYLENKVLCEISTVHRSFTINSLHGFDINPEIVQQSQKHLKDKLITISEHDIFSPLSPLDKTSLDRVVIINPPYGIRVGQKDNINSEYYQKLINVIQLKFAPKRIGIIIPSEYTINLPSNIQLISKLKFKNGGIPVSFYVLESK